MACEMEMCPFLVSEFHFWQLRLECLFFDCPSSIALHRLKLGVFEEMKEIESDASRNVLFKFYKLNYHDDYTFNFEKIHQNIYL